MSAFPPAADPPRRRTIGRTCLLLAAVTACSAVLGGALETEHAAAAPRTHSPSAGDAQRVQARLVSLRYLPAGAVTGRWDYRTTQAVRAFQGWEGLTPDGVVGPRTLAALASASPPSPRRTAGGRVIEVFRSRGVTLLVDQSRLVRAVHSSSGKPGFQTPAGTYRVFRQELRSWSYPYHVWLPYASYFNGGIAFHSSDDVPSTPASHGCVRIPSPEAAGVYAFATLGTRVVVY